jgi:uncharacterized protein (DUF1697 family)
MRLRGAGAEVRLDSMGQFIAFLRGINLGKRRVKMEALRAAFEELGFTDVQTFIASGNVAFTSTARGTTALETKIEAQLAKRFGYDVDTFVRTRAEVAAVVAAEPFSKAEMSHDENTVHVGFLKTPLPKASAELLRQCRTETDAFVVKDREFYWLCRIRTSESKVWASPAMKAVKLPTATLRNLSMLRRLAETFPA